MERIEATSNKYNLFHTDIYVRRLCAKYHMNYKTSIRNFDNKDWVWPERDIVAWRYLTREDHYNLPINVSNLVKNRNIVVQAGGHCGLYPNKYASLFKKVYTFEPHPENFYCLDQNIQQDNVVKNNLALGEKESMISLGEPLTKKKNNTGGYTVSGKGNIKLISLDSLDIEGCDLLHLDLEGFEWFALKGAVNLINKYRPLIVLETNDYCEMHGYTVVEMEQWIVSELKYKIIDKWEHDTVYAPE